jgi:hypothetical protein
MLIVPGHKRWRFVFLALGSMELTPGFQTLTASGSLS